MCNTDAEGVTDVELTMTTSKIRVLRSHVKRPALTTTCTCTQQSAQHTTAQNKQTELASTDGISYQQNLLITNTANTVTTNKYNFLH